MLLNRLHLPKKQRFPSIDGRGSVRIAAISGALILWAGTSLAMAQESPIETPGATATPGAVEPIPVQPVSPNASGAPGPINPSSPNAAPNPQNQNPAQNPNDQQAGNLQPGSQPPPNTPVPNTPLLPQQAGNPYTPFTSTSPLSPAQSPQITTPQLYTTGLTDVSQIATNTGLRQAFSEQPSSTGFLSEEQEGGYSYPPIERIRLGPVDLKAAVVSSIVNDDNLRTGSTSGGTTQGRGDTSYNITPAIMLEYGAHDGQRGYATVVYSPSIIRFLHQSSQDSDDQNVAFNAQYPFQRLTLNVSESYSETSGLNTDLNTRTTQNSNAVSFGGTYAVDDKLGVTVQLQNVQTTFSAPSGSSSSDTKGVNFGQGDEVSSLNTTVSYQYSDKLTFGPSFNVGVDKPDNAPQQTYEQATFGVTYQPTVKVTAFAQAGGQISEYDAGNNEGVYTDGGDAVNPVFSLGMSYAPFDSTTLSVNAGQSIHSSNADSLQTVVGTSVSASITQRFFQRLFLNVLYNYAHSENQSTSSGADVGAFAGQTQDQMTYRTSLSIAPTAWTSASLYYQYLDNESNLPGETYHDNQVGLAVSAQF
jgi:hypothetical protein